MKLRVYLGSCAGKEEASPAVSAWRDLAACDRVKVHCLTGSPEDANLILFVDLHLERDWRLNSLTSHSLVRKFPEKILVYNEQDRPWCVLPGLYCSMPRRDFDPSRQRACAYYAEVDSRMSGSAEVAPDLLFSFMGSQTHPVRKQIFLLRDSRAVIEDTSGFVFYDRSDKSAYEKQRFLYLSRMQRSKFVLCPRGAGTSSIRLFETLKAGRVPVIISDEWAPPAGPAWEKISVRIPERDVKSIPAKLRALEGQWDAMSMDARSAYETYFTRTVMFHNMMEACADLLGKNAPSLGPRYGRPYLAHALRGLLKR